MTSIIVKLPQSLCIYFIMRARNRSSMAYSSQYITLATTIVSHSPCATMCAPVPSLTSRIPPDTFTKTQISWLFLHFVSTKHLPIKFASSLLRETADRLSILSSTTRQSISASWPNSRVHRSICSWCQLVLNNILCCRFVLDSVSIVYSETVHI